MKDLKDELEKQIAALDALVVGKPEEPEIPAVVESVITEPVNRVSSNLVAVPKKEEEKTSLFTWCKTRLTLVLMQNSEDKQEPQFINVNGKNLYLNKPLSSFKIKSDDKSIPSEKRMGYLQTTFLPFASTLSDLTKPKGVTQLGTEKEAAEFYKDLGISIIEGVSRLLPSEDAEWFNLYCDITQETNSLVNDYVLEFYLVYKTDYSFDAELLSRLQKLESSVAKNKLVSNHFSLIVSAVFPLTMIPTDYVAWYNEGYIYENYLTTQYLPSNTARLDILGRLPNTKSHAVPHIVLSKVL